MKRSIWLLAGVVLLGSVAVREIGVRASQPLTSESEPVALDAIEKSDQMASPDCAQLTRLAMQAEVNVLGVKFASQSQPQTLAANLKELQNSVDQLRAFVFANPQVDRLRDEYAALLQNLLQRVGPLHNTPIALGKLDRNFEQVTQFNQEKILFNSCQVSRKVKTS
jgi:monomeric isocitrate dehydrogenase